MTESAEVSRRAASYITQILGVPEALAYPLLHMQGSPLQHQAHTLRKLTVRRLRLLDRVAVNAETLAADLTTQAAHAREGRQPRPVSYEPLSESTALTARITELDDILVELACDLTEAARVSGLLPVQEPV